MSHSAVQFRGVAPVVEAYELNKVPVWALFCGRNILGQYRGKSIDEGAQLLDAWLEKLKQGESTAAMQLRMYEEFNGKPITPSTPENYSFQFRLLDDEEYERSRPGQYSRGNQVIMDRLDAIEKRQLALLEEETDGEEEKIGGIQGMIGSLLEMPGVKEGLMQNLFGLIGKFTGVNRQPAAMAGTPAAVETIDTSSAAQLYADLDPVQKKQLDAALVILMQEDPKAGEKLYKLALLCRNNRMQYDMAAKML